MARTDTVWESTNGTYIKTTSPIGFDVLINGTSKYLNFNTVSGETGYGFRDNAGTMQWKNSGGSWANIGSVSGASPLTTKGDLYGYDTADARIPVGNNGEVLTADSTQTLGVKWAAVAGTGDVTAASAFGTDNVLIKSDGTGKGVQATGISVADTTNNVTGLGNLGATGATLSGLTASRAVVTDASKNLASSAVTDTELGYVSGVTSAIQTQLNAKGAGTVTSVAALTLGTTGTDLSSSVANGTTTPVITLNVPTASASNRGVLSSTDWSTFNNKQPAGSYLTSANFIDNEVVAGSGTSFTLANTPVAGSEHIFLNGMRAKLTTDYTISGTGITTTLSWSAGDVIADYRI